jgi:AraC family transcriptional regulator
MQFPQTSKEDNEIPMCGRTITRWQTSRFCVSECLFPAKVVVPPHSHKHPRIRFLLAGQFIERTSHGTYECRPAGFLTGSANEVHENQFGDEGARCLLIEVIEENPGFGRFPTQLFEAPTYFEPGLLTSIGMQLYHELLRKDSSSNLIIEGLLLELLGHASREFRCSSVEGQPRWLRDAMAYVREHFDEPISVFDVAAAVGVNPSRLAKLFKRYYQCSVGDSVRSLRMNYASKQLIETDKSIAEIAARAGFYDQSHFSNRFKQQMKVTPFQYRTTFSKRTQFDEK